MKTTSILVAISIFTGGALTVHAEKVQLEQLPVDLQQKIRAHTGAAEINDIDRTTKDGKTIYEVGFKKERGIRGLRQTELRFNEQGQLLNADGTAVETGGKVQWNELPAAVKATASQRVREAAVNDIDRRVKEGQTTYEIGFKLNDAQQELVISEEGKILRDVQVPEELLAGLRSRQESRDQLSPTPVRLSAKEKVELSSLPQRAQIAIATAAGGARIEDVERGTWNGQTVYEAAFKSGGQHVELQVADSGRIVNDPRPAAAGRPAASATGASKYPDAKSRITLSGAQKVERTAVPAAVERAIVTHTAGAKIEDVERGTWRNSPAYEVAFKDNGQHVELQMDENGEIIFDPRKNTR